MIHFDHILQLAQARQTAPIDAFLPATATNQQLLDISDDRWLAMMTRCIFQAGFVWRVIENKWPQFEQAFDGFHPLYWAQVHPDVLDELAKDERIVRNRQKINTVPINAQMINDLAREHGSFSQWLVHMGDDLPAIYQYLQKNGSRLGGNSAMYLMRMMGKDTYLYTDPVVRFCLAHQVIDTKPTSKKAKLALHQAFLTWQQQSQWPLSHISKLIALTEGV